LFITRRTITTALASVALGAGLSQLRASRSAVAQDVSVFDLVTPVPLGDVVLGSPTAPVTMIEYASMSCGHCAAFHETTFPIIKADYIDTGKVLFVFREFPLDLQAAAASMVVRCASKGDAAKYHETAKLLFSNQDEWVGQQSAAQLRHIAGKAGLDEAAFQTCIGSQEMVDALRIGRDHASAKLKVDSTPTFFINGVRVKGAYPIEEFRKVIEAKLKS
jgi:protein-disulfide isomerase